MLTRLELYIQVSYIYLRFYIYIYFLDARTYMRELSFGSCSPPNSACELRKHLCKERTRYGARQCS